MTQDRPNKADLLSIARTHLLDRVLPTVADAEKLDVLMVANAMAVVAREIASPPGEDRPDSEKVGRLLGDAAGGDRLDGELVRQIRAGVFDAPSEARSALLIYLEHDVRIRLAVANPRYLARRSGDEP